MNVPRAKLALLIAGVYSVALIIAGFLVPMDQTVYSSAPSDSGTSASSTMVESHFTATLVGWSGLGVVFVLVVPLLVTLAVSAALWQRARRGAMVVAWTLSGLLAAINIAGLKTMGLFLIPVTVALLYACSRCSPRSLQQNKGRFTHLSLKV
jgi:hypothetical protein